MNGRSALAALSMAAGLAMAQGTGTAPAPPVPPAPEPPPVVEDIDTRPAMAAASAWLSLVDAGLYARAWEESASAFREKVPRVKWEAYLQDARAALGPLTLRRLASAEHTRAIPGAPPGEYVVIRYSTSYANRPLVSETITPMRDADGTWRVAGYFIR